MYKIKGFKNFSNTYILRRFDSVLLIDPSFNYEKIKELIGGLRLTGILLTHAHSNHMGLIGRFNCPIYIHKEEYFTFIDDDLNGFNENDYKREYELNNINLKLIDEDTKIMLVDKEVQVIHTPGHSKGSLTFYFDNKLYTGDTLTKEGLRPTKRKGYSRYQLRKSVNKIYDSFSINTEVNSGHGSTTTLLEIRQKNETIRRMLK